MKRAAILLCTIGVSILGCSPANVFELEEDTTMVIPAFDGVTSVSVDDVTNDTFLPSNLTKKQTGWAENLRVERDGQILAQADTAKFLTRLSFEIQGVAYGLQVDDVEVYTFGSDSITLFFYRR